MIIFRPKSNDPSRVGYFDESDVAVGLRVVSLTDAVSNVGGVKIENHESVAWRDSTVPVQYRSFHRRHFAVNTRLVARTSLSLNSTEAVSS